MSNWKMISLSDIGRIVTGKTPKTSCNDNFGDAVLFLTPSDDMTPKHCYFTRRMLSNKGLQEVRNCLLPANSICVSCIGSDLGKVIKTTKKTVTNQQINSIIPNNKFNNDFIYYAMILLGKKMNFLSKTSTAIPIINKSSFSNYYINVPTIKDQQKIAAILGALDDKIECNNRINRNLEEQATALFRRWFIENRDNNWGKSQLDSFGEIICGKTPPKSNHEFFGGNIPFIKIPDMHNNTFIIDTEDSLTTSGANFQKNKSIPPQSILVSCIATVGLVSINTKISQSNQQINTIIPQKEYYKHYLYLRLKEMHNKLQLLASGGSATLNLNTRQFSKISIDKPDDNILIYFHNCINPIFQKIEINQKENKTIAALRDSILPQLMNNKISLY